MIKRFYDLEVWKMAHQLSIQVYKITKTFPEDEKYGLTSQLRRATTSVSANIAEGFGRYHYKDKIKFYYNARGSACKAQNFILFAKDVQYIEQKTTDDLLKDCELRNSLFPTI